MVADFSIHLDNENNPHAHILLTMRRVNKDGFLAKKDISWNRVELLKKWRELWANNCNKTLNLSGFAAQIDHRSYSDRGINLEPTIHLGRAHFAWKYRRQVLDRFRLNQGIIDRNLIRKSSIPIEDFGFFPENSKFSYSVLVKKNNEGP